MTSSERKFREKYQYSEKNEKDKISNTKRTVASLGLAVTMSATLLGGCSQANKNDKEGISIEKSIVEPTKEDGKQYTEKEQKQIKKLLERKEEFLDKVIEEYNHTHSLTISANEIEILKFTNLYAFHRNEKYFLDQDKDGYKGCNPMSRNKEDCDFMIINNQNNKILFSISKINGELHETYIFGYYDKEQIKKYLNDKNYGTIVNNEYTTKECFKGAEALFKYNTNEQYKNWEKYFNNDTRLNIDLER